MRVDYFYNEKLPKRTAHDSYVWRNCFYLSQSGVDVTLVTGPSKLSLQQMQRHYVGPGPLDQGVLPLNLSWKVRGLLGGCGQKGNSSQVQGCTGSLAWLQLPLLRKSQFLKLSWNLPFFWRCQKWLQVNRPDWAFFSVYKQAHFHLKRRVPGVKYLFEVQDLAWYPNSLQPTLMQNIPKSERGRIEMQRAVLQACDKVTTTTIALKTILQQSPYSITTPIEVIPLGSEHQPLQSVKTKEEPIRLGYVGQLYPHQGVDALIDALVEVPGVHLDVLGGSHRDVQRIQSLIDEKGMHSRVRLHGFIQPSEIADKLHNVDVLVAPFYPTLHMRYVAHTKLADYGRWALPVMVPSIEGIEEELRSPGLIFEASQYPRSNQGLVDTIKSLCEENRLKNLQEEVDLSRQQFPDRFHWHERCKKLKNILSQ